MTAITTLTTALSHILVTASPFFILFSIARSPRSVINISGETLVLLTFSSVYFSLPNLLSLHDILPKIHILALGVASYYTIRFQGRLYIPESSESLIPLRPEASEQAVEGEEVQEERRPVRKVPDCIKFSPFTLLEVILRHLFIALITGQHSLTIRVLRWFRSETNPNFWTVDLPHVAFLFFTLTNTNAMLRQYVRITTFTRVAANLETIVGAHLARKVKIPSEVWAFVVTSAIGAGLMLPELIKKAGGMSKQQLQVDEEDMVITIVGASGSLAYLVGIVLLLRFAPKLNKQDSIETAEATQEPVSTTQHPYTY